jgi:hypothetical protein
MLLEYLTILRNWEKDLLMGRDASLIFRIVLDNEIKNYFHHTGLAASHGRYPPNCA